MRRSVAVQFGRRVRFTHFIFRVIWPVLLLALFASTAQARQYAAYIMDARTGQTLYSYNADARINPASLTKMMTLYITFQEIESGRVSLDTLVTVSREAAGMPPSRLGLRAGQKIALRYLIRAAAVKSANDAAAAIGDYFAGSPEAWGARMTATARELGMMHTTFRNANGLTEQGHLSTARDLTILGRHLFYDFPQYFNLFSRRSADASIAKVYTTNHAFLNGYKGADGIKTGYTSAAGFNLTASAERGDVHIIGTVVGMNSPAARTSKVEKLFDAAFRKAPKHVREQPTRMAALVDGQGRTLVVTSSPRPPDRPVEIAALGAGTAQPRVASTVAGMQDAIAGAVAAASAAAPPAHTLEFQAAKLAATNSSASAEQPGALSAVAAKPERQAPIYGDSAAVLAGGSPDQPPPPAPEVIRVSTSGGGNWGVTLGRYNTRDEAERLLLQVQLSENATLGESLRKVVPRGGGYDANFFGLSQYDANLACRRLDARGQGCTVIGPS